MLNQFGFWRLIVPENEEQLHDQNIKELMNQRKVINKYKVGKFVHSTITDGVYSWSSDEEKIREEEQFDGCYVIFTNVPKEEMEIEEVVKNYRKLIHVEQAFRNVKTVQLQIRQVYHKTDDRVDCHVFLCMLSYYLMWNMKQRLKPLMDSDSFFFWKKRYRSKKTRD